MKVRILTTHYMTGLGSVAEGAVIEVDVHEARRKIAMGYAEAYEEPLPHEEGVVRFDDSAVQPDKSKGKK